MRLHGIRKPADRFWDTGGRNEIWFFGDTAYEIIPELLFLRERLRPYTMEPMQVAHARGVPPMRLLFFDFPHDEDCLSVDDQFMFGPGLLVLPVLKEGARFRQTALPAGTIWRDAWSATVHQGGQQVMVEAPLECIPLYLCGEARLPIRRLDD